MHSPMPTPPGFEEELSLRAIFPGLRVPPIKDFAHFTRIFRAAWRSYRHFYFPIPEIVAEEEAAREKARRRAAVVEARRKRFEGEATEKVKEGARQVLDAMPGTREEVWGRLDVLNDSLSMFMKGFNEVASGETGLFGDKAFHPDVVRKDNKPLVYVVVEEEEGEEG